MKKKDCQTKWRAYIGSTSIGILALLLVALLLPTTRPEASATDCLPGESPCTTTMSETGVDLMVASTVSVALESRVNLDIIPKTSGAFTETTSKLTIATNNPSGYAVYMQAGKVVDNKASLISTDLSNNATISPVEGRVSSSSFLANTWGYSLDGENYQAVPATTSKVKETATTTFNDTYDLSFGVKVDTNLPAGQYYNSVIVSAVANPINITSLNQLTYMQDMTSDICANTAENVTKQLIDTRDGKSYWVAKLKDGNCWMTQNLALDITQSMIDNGSLNPSNTDIAFTWGSTPAWTDLESWKTLGESFTSENYQGPYVKPSPTNSFVVSGNTMPAKSSTAYSWSQSKVLLAAPNLSKACGGSIGSNENIADFCRDSGFIDVSSAEWSPVFVAQDGTYKLSDNSNYTGFVTADISNHTYDAHYLVGNYYQYNTATASTGSYSDGVSVNTANAPSSICPKGWKLPTSYSYFVLLRRYNYVDSGGATTEGYESAEVVKTLSMVKAGLLAPDSGYFSNSVGSIAYYVSSTGKYNAGVDALIVSGPEIGSWKWLYRSSGFTLRCVSR